MIPSRGARVRGCEGARLVAGGFLYIYIIRYKVIFGKAQKHIRILSHKVLLVLKSVNNTI